MMNFLNKIYHFLGSIHFAITLIATTAVFVIAGTLIESYTDSHRYAAAFTYANPIFLVLLFCFFINILVSALRRWPFKLSHIPFLTTHLGLLMILAGVIMKSLFGVQGTMSIMEGGGSHEISLPDTYAIQIENRDPSPVTMNIPLTRTWLGHFEKIDIPLSFSELQVQLVGFVPHSRERLDTWIKGGLGYIRGVNPFVVHQLLDSSPIPLSTRLRLHHPGSTPWNLFAGSTSAISESARKAYVQETNITFTNAITHQLLFQESLEKALRQPIAFGDWTATIALHFNHSTVSGFDNPCLQATLVHRDGFTEQCISEQCISEQRIIPLQGPNSLAPHLSKTPIHIDIQRTPSLVLLQDPDEDLFFFAFNSHGEVTEEAFRHDNRHSLIVYDQGFGGYAAQMKIPFSAYPSGRKEREQARVHTLAMQLRDSLTSAPVLIPPLQLLYNACQQSHADFVEIFLLFLVTWNDTHQWLFPNIPLPLSVEAVLNQIDWQSISSKEKAACCWTHELFASIEPELKQGKHPLHILKEHNWPLLSLLESPEPNTIEEPERLLTRLTQQIFAIADQLPAIQEETAPLPARLLSAYLRAYEIHLHTFLPPLTDEEMNMQLRTYMASHLSLSAELNAEEIILECPITARQCPEPFLKKMEDNRPKVTLQIHHGPQTEQLSLTYDPHGQGLKWPALGSLFRFQPLFKEIPYHVRLRQAQQINYANSGQPYSYESDLIITDRRDGVLVEKKISMNHVHETWDGYRFYLANIAPSNENTVKTIQLVINHDPAKYVLTYPGALILSLGIILLFWIRPKN